MENSIIDTVDAVVIGAGTIGSATAWHLAKRGLKNVVLIERNTIGSGNTSKAASLMTLVRTKEELIPLIQETYRNIEEIEAYTGEKTGLNKVGTLHIASTEESVLNLEKITINDFSFLANYIFHLNDVQYYKPDDKFNKNILHDIQKDIHELLIASKYKNDIINTILSKSENYYKLNDTSEIDKISTIEWLYGLDIFIENMK